MASRDDTNYRVSRMLSLLLAVFSLAAFPGLAHASNNCPWINEATVSGLLEGAAVGTFSQGPAGQNATCTFVRRAPDGTRTLTIAVETTQDPHARVISLAKGCSRTPEVLQAIGNEAYRCITEHGKHVVADLVAGRVRDQVFTIVIGTSGKAEALLTPADLKSRLSIAAEQVSGNLF